MKSYAVEIKVCTVRTYEAGSKSEALLMASEDHDDGEIAWWKYDPECTVIDEEDVK